MTRVLLIGGSGQLGRVIRHMLSRVWRIEAPPSGVLDVTNDTEVLRYIKAYPCDVILNCSAFTRVDDAESQRADAERLSAHAPGVLAEAAARVSVLFVHISTDYVFDGTGQPPYAPDALCHPLSEYGRTKLAGEVAVVAANPRSIVVRTSWLHSSSPTNFVARATQLLIGGHPMRVVCDQIGAPTHCASLANALHLLIERSAPQASTTSVTLAPRRGLMSRSPFATSYLGTCNLRTPQPSLRSPAAIFRSARHALASPYWTAKKLGNYSVSPRCRGSKACEGLWRSALPFKSRLRRANEVRTAPACRRDSRPRVSDPTIDGDRLAGLDCADINLGSARSKYVFRWSHLPDERK